MVKNTTHTDPVVKPVTVRLPYPIARALEDIAHFHYTDIATWIAEQIEPTIYKYDLDAIRQTLKEREEYDNQWNPRRKSKRKGRLDDI